MWSDNPKPDPNYVKQLRNLRDEKTKQRLLYGNFEYDDDPATLIEYDAIVDLFTNVAAKGDKYLSCDVARYGQDKTVIALWNGYECYRLVTYEKQGIDQTIERIKDFAATEGIPYSRCIVDEDGVGGGVVDGLRGIKGFVANSVAILGKEGHKENYANLKSQCTYRFAEAVNARTIAIHCDNMEIRAKIVEELEQIKAKDVDKDGKLGLISKDKIKEIIGRSPDFSDTMMMRMIFDVKPSQSIFHPTTNYPKYHLDVRQPA
jgi:hypothetical protein